MGSKCNLCLTSKILAIIGALNWGLVGAFNYNLVEGLLGTWPIVVRLVYILVGLAGVYLLVVIAKGHKSGTCPTSHAGSPGAGGM